jgi:hypothetical protein
MATWITDRTQADIDRVKEIAVKARTGTWTEEEQQEWAAGMKGALNYTDYNRIESGIKELAGIVGAPYSARIVQKRTKITTARNADGGIPSWDAYPSHAEFFVPLTVKKSGLLLHSMSFRIKGFVAGKIRAILRKAADQTRLVDLSLELIRGYNDVTLDMGDLPLEKGVEYQLYMSAVNNFYPPSVEPEWVVENDYIDFANASAYYDGDSKILFAGIATVIEPVEAVWGVDDYLTTDDCTRWLSNISAIRSKCSGKGSTPETPGDFSYRFAIINQIEKVLFDIESIAKDHSVYCSELICGGEPYYAVY